MVISKSKNYSQVSLSEIKEDLDIDNSDLTYDSRISRLIKSAVAAVEDYCQEDFVTTTNVLEEDFQLYPFNFIEYKINFPNISVTGITVADVNGNITTVDPANYKIEKYSSFTIIRFKTGISGNVLKVYYRSGSSTLPEAVKRAIAIKVKEFLDVDRSGYVSSVTETKIFERLLNPYRNLIYS